MTLKRASTGLLGLNLLFLIPLHRAYMMPSLTAKTCTFRLQSCAHAYTLNSTATEQHSTGSHTCAIFLNVNKYQFWLLRPVTSAGYARQWAIKRLFTAHLSYRRSPPVVSSLPHRAVLSSSIFSTIFATAQDSSLWLPLVVRSWDFTQALLTSFRWSMWFAEVSIIAATVARN